MENRLEEVPGEWCDIDDQEMSLCDGWEAHDWFYQGLVCGFPVCCIIWFHDVWMPSVNEKMGDDYADKFENGYIPCPECIVRMLEEKKKIET